METAQGSPQPESFTSLPSAVFPLYHVLAAVGDFSDGETLAVTSENAPQIPAPVEALALHQGHRLGILLANLMPAVQHVIVRGLQGPVKVRYLDERNAERAMIAPEAFQTAKGEQLDASREGIGLRLLPYAGVRIDSSTC
jgi:hypothetical protein